MPRPERPIGPGEAPVQKFALALRELRRSAGSPTYRELARRTHYSVTTLAQAAAGERLPTLDVALAYAGACDGDRQEWTARWRAAAADLDTAAEPETAAVDPGDDRPPYLGLAAYRTGDADLFRGRDRLVTAAVQRLAGRRFLAVVGASGSGKSSLLHAGLIPALQSGDDQLTTVAMTPGSHPVSACAARLAELSDHDAADLTARLAADPGTLGRIVADLLPVGRDAGCLLVVDQFEEVFSLCEDAVERETFIRALLAAAHDPESRTTVVIGLRADFYAHCARLPELAAELQDAQLIVGPMTPEELSAAITEPAARAGLMVEKALVATIIAAAADRPAALPFVSHALWETWRRRRGAGLFLAAYQSVGGLDGAVAQSAEKVYRALDDRHRQAARRILLRLTALGDGTEDTRRRATRAELGDDAVTAQVLERLAAARLVAVGDDTVEITHEALIRGWPTLRDWLATDRESLRAHRSLAGAAAEWAAHGHDDAFLYRGSRLAGWADRRTEGLNELERAFLAAGEARETRDRNRDRRRLRVTVGALTAGLLVVSILAVLAVVQTDTANTQRDLAAASRLAAQSRAVLADQPELASLLALAGLRHTVTAETVASAQAALAAPIHVASPLIGHTGKVTAVAYSPDGRVAVTGGEDGTVRLWNTGSAAMLTVLRHGDAVNAVAYSHSGRVLASAGHDRTVKLWDPGTGQLLATLTGSAPVDAVAFGAGDKTIATGDTDGAVRVWDIETRRVLTRMTGHDGPVYAVAFSPDGHTLATGGDDSTARLWDPSTGRQSGTLPGHTAEVFGVAFSPDGRTLATGSADGTARLWDVGTKKTTGLLNEHTRLVQAVAFAADGRSMLTASWDGTVRLWDTATRLPLAVFTGHIGEVLAAAMSPDGRTILAGGADGTARLWSVAATRPIATLEGHTGWVDAVAYSPGGRVLATGSRDGTARLWDTDGRTPPVILDAKAGHVYAVAFSPDGTILATGHEDGTIRLWDVASHRQTDRLDDHSGPADALAFSPDGRLLASGYTDNSARLWNVAARRVVVPLRGHTGWVDGVAFSPDGDTVASSSTDGTVRLWNARTGAVVTVLRAAVDRVSALAFSPDGKTLAVAPPGGTAQLWNVASGDLVAALAGHTDNVTSIAYSPDGRSLATASRDGTTRLWDAATHKPIIVLGGHDGWVTAVAFSPDGQTLATTSWDRTVRLTPHPDAWPGLLCRRAGRNLTRDEWRFYVGSEPYRRLCPEFAPVPAP